MFSLLFHNRHGILCELVGREPRGTGYGCSVAFIGLLFFLFLFSFSFHFFFLTLYACLLLSLFDFYFFVCVCVFFISKQPGRVGSYFRSLLRLPYALIFSFSFSSLSPFVSVLHIFRPFFHLLLAWVSISSCVMYCIMSSGTAFGFYPPFPFSMWCICLCLFPLVLGLCFKVQQFCFACPRFFLDASIWKRIDRR
jgi:hypothetical protein